MVTPNPFLGVGMHGVGAMFAANCYAPQKFHQTLVLGDLLDYPIHLVLVALAYHRGLVDHSGTRTSLV